MLVAAARALRELHDATAGFARAGRVWQLAPHEPDEVICHNDFAPYNLVFRDGELAGAIDFEAASPGPRVWDLAYLAYRLVPLTAPANPDGRDDTDRPARLARLCAAYGGIEPAEVLAVVPARLDELADFSDAHGRAGRRPPVPGPTPPTSARVTGVMHAGALGGSRHEFRKVRRRGPRTPVAALGSTVP